MLAAIPLSGENVVFIRHPLQMLWSSLAAHNVWEWEVNAGGCSFKQFCFMDAHTWTSTTPGPGSGGLSCLRIDPSDRESALQPLQEFEGNGVVVKMLQNKWDEKESVQWMCVEHQFSFSFCFLGQKRNTFFPVSLSSRDCMSPASTLQHLICRDCLKPLSLHNIHLPLGCKSPACVSLC